MLWDELDKEDGGKIFNPYTWIGYACGTCGGLSLYGAFFDLDIGSESIAEAKLHPRGADILPPPHMMSPNQPVPGRVLSLYVEAWPLRHKAPSAFVGQIRRLLEFVRTEQSATGRNLFEQLTDLSTKGVFPGYFTKITDLLRKVGNMGAHAGEEDLSVWDAELIDDFFRSVIEYIYIAPAKIRRMETRLERHLRLPSAPNAP
jgi:Domain of unknown function (DUF4145)